MRIISKFHDYYDKVVAYGHDDHVTWIRKSEELDQEKNQHPFYKTDIWDKFPHLGRPSWNGTERRELYDITPMIVGFCGKLYPVYKLVSHEYNYSASGAWQPTYFCYSIADFEKALMKLDLKGKELKEFQAKSKMPRRYRTYHHMVAFHKDIVEQYFAEFSGQDEVDLFVEFKTPVLLIEPMKITVTPSLRDIQFHRVMDPFTAYQEIEMYLSGILGLSDPETVHIDDKHMAQQKGFDEWSFKRLPKKKR